MRSNQITRNRKEAVILLMVELIFSLLPSDGSAENNEDLGKETHI